MSGAKGTALKFVFQRIICPACVIFTALTVLFSVLLSLSGTMMYLPMMDLASVAELLGFSVVVALANLLFSSKLPFGAALALHFAATVGGFGLIFLLIGKHYGSPSGAWSLLAVVAAAYVAAAVVVCVIRLALRKKQADKEEYKRQF